MKQVLIGLLCSLVFIGCANKEKLTYPKGKWIEVNPKGYIPENTQKYVKDAEKEGVFNELP